MSYGTRRLRDEILPADVVHAAKATSIRTRGNRGSPRNDDRVTPIIGHVLLRARKLIGSGGSMPCQVSSGVRNPKAE